MTNPSTLTRKLNRLSLPIVQGSCYASVAKSLAFPVGLPTCCPLVMVLPNSINLRYNHAFQGISQPSQFVTTIVVNGYWWSKVYRSQQKMLYKDAKFILKPKELTKYTWTQYAPNLTSVFTDLFTAGLELPAHFKNLLKPCDIEDMKRSDHKHSHPDVRDRGTCVIAKITIAKAVRLMVAGTLDAYWNRVSRVARSGVAWR